MEFVKPFQFNTFITKAASEGDDMVVYGPIHPLEEDYDKDILTKAFVQDGLKMFRKLNSHVDWDHKYRDTGDPQYLIGYGLDDYEQSDGRMGLKTRLYKSSAIARDVFQKLNEGATFGYSIDGVLHKRDDKDRRKLISGEIHRITIAPSPKGFGNYLKPGEPPATAMAVAKAICRDGQCFSEGRVPAGWLPIESPEAQSLLDDDRLSRLESRIDHLLKAFTTGSGVVQPGSTGGQALRTQFLSRASSAHRCSKCGRMNNARRTHCRECGKVLRKRHEGE